MKELFTNGIPLHEAAEYFISLTKTAEDPQAAVAPSPDLLPLFTSVAEAEFISVMSYHVYAQTMRSLSRDGVATQFEEHAGEELDHADYVLKRMSLITGGGIDLPAIQPPAPLTDAVQIIQALVTMEQDGIERWKALHAALEENDPTRFKVEEYLTDEQHHLDDLMQYLPQLTAEAAPVAAPEALPPPEAPTPQIEVKTASVTRLEKVLPGTEHCHSQRMLDVLNQLPAKAFYANMGLDGEPVHTVRKTAGIGGALGGIAGKGALGAAVGGIAGGLTTDETGHHSLGRAATGALLGGAIGAGAGGYKQLRGAMGGAPAGALTRIKAAFQEMMGGPTTTNQGAAPLQESTPALAQVPAQPPPPVGEEIPGVDPMQQQAAAAEWTANEQAAQQAEQAAANEFYKAKFQQAAQQLQEVQQQTSQLQEQVQGSEAQIQASVQAARSAQSTASQALQQQLQSADEALKNQQLATQMRMAYQAMRGQMMDIVSQDPAASVGQQLTGSSAESAAIGPNGQSGQPPQGGQPSQPGQPGSPDQGQGEVPTQGETQPAVGAEQAGGATGSPTAAPPQGQSQATNQGNAETTPATETKHDVQKTPSLSVKVGFDENFFKGMANAKNQEEVTRLVEPYAKKFFTHAKSMALDVAVGAAIGAAAGVLTSHRNLAPLEEKVNTAQQNEGKTYKGDISLAKARFELEMGKIYKKYPKSSILASTVLGAKAGPFMMNTGRDIVRGVKDLVSK